MILEVRNSAEGFNEMVRAFTKSNLVTEIRLLNLKDHVPVGPHYNFHTACQ